MAWTQEPVTADRPQRPWWVYGLGFGIVLMLVGTIIFAVIIRSESYVAPENGEPPIITVPSAPTDGEGR
ncbi:MAG: hypothetical protein M3434_04145 [Gemmatimonadota bacterium]|nr:hypothetical protein [Gemmatimonadota bacterium]